MVKRILLAEDDPQIARLVSFKLQKEGYEVTCAEDGGKTLAAVKDGRFDLILLDIMMPVIDGFQILEKLKGDPALKDIPVIMLTAKGQEQDILASREIGAADYIVKPFNLSELVERVEKAIESARERGSH
jgi:DNA-binding response OmpR family regulator